MVLSEEKQRETANCRTRAVMGGFHFLPPGWIAADFLPPPRKRERIEGVQSARTLLVFERLH
jgi:hypothetical protein